MNVAKSTLFNWRLMFVILTVVALAIPAVSQTTSTFTGTVKDPTGAVVPGAEVTVTHIETNFTKTVTTNAQGLYRVIELPVGTYRIEASSTGFKTAVVESVPLGVGVIERLDLSLEVGSETETVIVDSTTQMVNTEDSRPYITVSGRQIEDLPLNGRNVYNLMQLAPGAVNVDGVSFENGEDTSVNGMRPNFNGFTVNGVSNKGLSGGTNTLPNPDIVEEFQMITLNVSAEYGNSAGSITNLVTKSGGNDLHGSAFYFFRRDSFDATSFFTNAAGRSKNPLDFDQFGGVVTGKIIEDKLFFTASLQIQDFLTLSPPTTVLLENPAFASAVSAAAAGGPVADYLYTNFASTFGGTSNASTVDSFVNSAGGGFAWGSWIGYQCPENLDLTGAFGVTIANPAAPLTTAQQFQALYGVTLAEITYGADGIPGNADDGLLGGQGTLSGLDGVLGTADDIQPGGLLDWAIGAGVDGIFGNADDVQIPNCPTYFGGAGPGVIIGQIGRSTLLLNNASVSFPSQTLGNLRDGNDFSGRIDWVNGDKDRIFVEYYWQDQTDIGGGSTAEGSRGFQVPFDGEFPNLQASYNRTISPTLLNEFKFGWFNGVAGFIAEAPGVPQAAFDDGVVQFGAYNGFPQFFDETVMTFSDHVSITQGSHNLKVGFDLRLNQEESEFNVGRPSMYFFDQLFFSIDLPYSSVAGVDPQFGTVGGASLRSNVRDWSNKEVAFFIQDDWKVHPRVTLQLGLRYDQYFAHTEGDNLETTFLPGPANSQDADGWNLGWVLNANQPSGTGTCTTAQQIADVVLAGVCGPGGFAAANELGASDTNNFGPRIGFAWDITGDGKTSLRGGWGLSYEGTLFNPLSNSRWNPPHYSFNLGFNWLLPIFGNDVPLVYGPSVVDGTNTFLIPTGDPITHLGTNTNPGAGPVGDATGLGNIMGWFPFAPNQSFLTGIVFPEGIEDPEVQSFHLQIQRELPGDQVFEIAWVRTRGEKLFTAENVNRVRGSFLPGGGADVGPDGILGTPDDIVDPTVPAMTSTIQGVSITGLGRGNLNPNYGTLRAWLNIDESWYDSLQASIRKRMSNGIMYNLNYTWSHSLDTGSGWHSGATTANGNAAGDAYSFDPLNTQIDKGNSTFDVRHRLVGNMVYDLPFGEDMEEGAAKKLVHGWQVNVIYAWQTGAHWTPFDGRAASLTCLSATDITQCSNARGDYNLDGLSNDRPDVGAGGIPTFNDTAWANGFGGPGLSLFGTPCLGCNGNFPRNGLVGPEQINLDFSLIKNVNINEDQKFQFRFEVFNAGNTTNFVLPASNKNRIDVSNFATSQRTLIPRQIQFGFKYIF